MGMGFGDFAKKWGTKAGRYALEKAKEINNYLCLYDILSRIIKKS